MTKRTLKDLGLFARKVPKSHISRMVVAFQHRMIQNTFNRQLIKTTQDDILCASNFCPNLFSIFYPMFQTLLCLAMPASFLFFYLYTTLSCSCSKYLHSYAMIFDNRVFCLKFETNLQSPTCLETQNTFLVIASFVFVFFSFYWVK